MRISRIMIASPKSGSGKTTITCALLQALKDGGKRVYSYKCGPDYIDPMFHQQVIGVPSKNLDTFFTDTEKTKQLFLRNRTEGDFAVLEGVMGLFDGLGGVREEGSSYHLAEVTRTPIILVVDAKGMGRSVIPMIAGFLAYDRAKLIKGVILNRMSRSYYEIIKPIIEQELEIAALGYFPECERFQIKSRHLGLVMPNEIEHIREQLHSAAEEFHKTVFLEKVIQIADEAEEPECCDEKLYNEAMINKVKQPVIAVARDAAFQFYYEDNLFLLEKYGAKLAFFSPMYDKKLPDRCSGILIGGGYPELYAGTLSRNTEMLAAVKAAMEDKLPVVAECGGFMYLHSIVENREGECYSMVGAIDGRCFYTGRLVRFGYVEIMEKQKKTWTGGKNIRGHEFHYFDSEYNGADCLAMKPVSKKAYDCILADENHWLGFPHLYYPSNPEFAERFVEKARNYTKRKGW